ncbi:chemotaxis protein CheA [uncultured Tateyamaria sp.]|uniref:chemotaxis protein CheA n=1 Tax=Tateyamaria sp. 1078 TaxID=3417464 RepID=UPI00261F0BCC|nr:chemotaxis protein CheA [uncultured Tateyamaria sp.]
MTSPDPMAEIKASFFIECEELLEAMQDGLQRLDDGDDDPETINVVFRAVHSIKGGAGAFGLEPMVRFAHRFETVLDGVRAGAQPVTPDLTKLFFRAGDHLSDIVRACRDDVDFPPSQSDAILSDLDSYISRDAADTAEDEIEFQPMALSLDLDLPSLDTPPEPPRWRITFTPEADMYESGNEVFPILSALADLGQADIRCDTSKVPGLTELAPESAYLSWSIDLNTTVEEAEIRSVFEFVEGLCDITVARADTAPQTSLPDLPPLVSDPPGAPPEREAVAPTEVSKPAAKPASQPAQANAAKTVVRVDLDRIERLVNLVGELVINQAMLAQSLESEGLSPHSDAMNGLEEFQRLTRDIQDSVMMIRAQPVKPLFQRMSRIVREASAAVDKDVHLITDGETTEVDKTVIERLADPLTHMIRNAVDHGLESTEDRVKAGKSPEGSVKLSAAHRSGRVVIEVSDDGSGINRPKVHQIAIDKGLVAEDAVLSDTEIDNLLFLPGFSTASCVSDLSGRGVGMDVVKTAIQSLGGRITITSAAGEGTTFSISLPLTLAVLDGMVVDVAQETLVVPLNVVSETLTIRDDTVDEVEPGTRVVRVRGGFVPLFDLGSALGYRAEPSNLAGSVALLIVQEDGSRAALIVDEIQDQRQVVIKGLDDAFCSAPGIAAATILGDGQIALIIDPSDIIAHTPKHSGSHAAPLRMEA